MDAPGVDNEKPSPAQLAGSNMQIGENGQLITDYIAKHNITQFQLDKIKEKFKREKDFALPQSEVEKEFATDMIIEQLVEVKNGQWGKPVKLDQKQLKFLIDEATKIFSNEKMLLDLEAPIKIFGDVHGQYFDLFRLFDIAGYPHNN